MNTISIGHNMLDNQIYLKISTTEGIFACPVEKKFNVFPTVEISNDDLLLLRNFLNEIIDKRMKE